MLRSVTQKGMFCNKKPESMLAHLKDVYNEQDWDLINYLENNAEPLGDTDGAFSGDSEGIVTISITAAGATPQVEQEGSLTITGTSASRVKNIPTTTGISQVESIDTMTAANATQAEDTVTTTASGSPAEEDDIVFVSVSQTENIPSNCITAAGTPEVQIHRQTRSQAAAAAAKGSHSKTPSDIEKGKMSLNNANNLVDAARTAIVVLHKHNPDKDAGGFVSMKKNSNAAPALSDDEPEVIDNDIDNCENESVLVHSKTKSKAQVKITKPGPKLLSALGKSKRTGTGCKTDQNKSKSNVTSIKVLRVVRSNNDINAEDDVAEAVEVQNRRNAEMARQNRLKKKSYVENLEKELEDNIERVDKLESSLNNVEAERDALKQEVEYLKAVLENQSALAELLKNIPNTSGVTLSSSLSRKRESNSEGHPSSAKKQRPRSSGGVCLHVSDGNVSLEMCHRCAEMACGTGTSTV